MTDDTDRQPDETATPALGEPFERDFLTSGQNVDDLSPLEEQIRDVMKSIYDPEIPVPIWDLGLIYLLDVDDENNVYIKMTLTAPNCPVADTLPAEVEEKVNAIADVKTAKVDLTFDPPYLPDYMSEEAKVTLGFM